MIKRCYNVDSIRFKDWGGRGIRVCEAWRKNVWTFIRWGESHGWKLGLELDRRNNDGNYSPANCRFVTDKEQANNRRPRQLTAAGIKAISRAVTASNRRRFATDAGRDQALHNLEGRWK